MNFRNGHDLDTCYDICRACGKDYDACLDSTEQCVPKTIFPHRCAECSLLRVVHPGMSCTECIRNELDGINEQFEEKHWEVKRQCNPISEESIYRFAMRDRTPHQEDDD